MATVSSKELQNRQTRKLRAVRRLALGCQRCDLWKGATQTVFGAGRASAPMMLVGEQPGDAEDLAGEPFVGPAGRLLKTALDLAGLGETPCYLTNAVKHFKFEPRGKRRIHQKPAVSEVLACRYWLEEEIALVHPTVVVALGATALRSLVGPGVSVTKSRGTWVTSALAPQILVTVHPASILRERDPASRASAMQAFVEDLRQAMRKLRERT